MTKNQKGFGHWLILLGTILVLAIAGTSYYVWHRNHNKITVDSYASCVGAGGAVQQSYPTKCIKNGKSFTNPDQKISAASSSSSTPSSSSSYLTVKEWGIKLPLSTADAGAYYTAPVTYGLADSISVFDKSVDALKNPDGVSCKDDNYPLLVVSRAKVSDVPALTDPNNPNFVSDTGPSNFTSLSFNKDYDFAWSAHDQAAPNCLFYGNNQSSDSISQAYTNVQAALEKSASQIQAE